MNSLSYSQQTTWLGCRQRWYYEYVAKPDVPMYLQRDLLRGSAGHAALEVFYAAPPSARTLGLLQANAEAYLDEMSKSKELNDIERKDLDTARQDVHAALTEFWRTVGTDADYTDVKTEHRASRPLSPGWDFHAVLDGLIEKENFYIILEHKFPLYLPPLSQYTLWSAQGRLCAWALDVDKAVFLVYNVVSRQQTTRLGPFPVSRGQEAVRIAWNVAAEIDQAIVYPNYSFACLRCPYKTECTDRLIGGEI